MTLQVIGAGYGRTGTLTLKTALELLGFGPCHHMLEVIGNPAQVPFWNRAADGEDVDWEEIFGTYRATVDWPGCHFYRELSQRYPEAKVILSTRDPERWFESMNSTILPGMKEMGLDDDMPADHPMRFGKILIADKAFNFDFSKENVMAALERHNAAVKAAIPASRLLEFEVSSGWEPLCEFLDVPVPSAPFPKTNTRENFGEHVNAAKNLSKELK